MAKKKIVPKKKASTQKSKKATKPVARKSKPVAAKKASAAKKSTAAKPVKSAKAGAKKAATKPAATKKATPAKRVAPSPRVYKRGSRESSVNEYRKQGLGSEAAGQSGDIEGISGTAGADSESVEELLEEGQSYEADVVRGVEEAPDPDESEVTTEEVPEDDVPEEYGGEDGEA